MYSMWRAECGADGFFYVSLGAGDLVHTILKKEDELNTQLDRGRSALGTPGELRHSRLARRAGLHASALKKSTDQDGARHGGLSSKYHNIRKAFELFDLDGSGGPSLPAPPARCPPAYRIHGHPLMGRLCVHCVQATSTAMKSSKLSQC